LSKAYFGKVSLCLKNNLIARRAGGVAYVVGHLHSKCQALITNLNTAKRKERGMVKKQRGGEGEWKEKGREGEGEGSGRKGKWKGKEKYCRASFSP
jgi:hypothetical protein